jgi:hypothetical protein
MSVFDVPRLHFAGVAVTRLPTGPRSGLLDLRTNQALTEDGPFPVDRSVHEYHDYLDRHGTRFDEDGQVAPAGRFSSTKGWNFGGNGHFWIDATIRSWEAAPGVVDSADEVIGRQADMWGHYNDYLATTFNRARVFDVDPASNWTTAVMVGQFGFGRAGRSHDTGYQVLGQVNGVQPPRWQNARHIHDVGRHLLGRQFQRSVLYQFVVDAHDLDWFDETSSSVAATQLRTRVESGEAAGLVVQFALTNMASPTTENAPDFWDVRGTIAPWRPEEPRTYPAGRLLTPRHVRPASGEPLPHNLAVQVDGDHVTANLITAVPVTSRRTIRGPGPTHQLGPLVDLGDLELRTRHTDRLVARIPGAAYKSTECAAASGILTVPTDPGWSAEPEEPLCLVAAGPGGQRTVLLTEEETVVQVDEACLFLEHPDRRTGDDFAVEVPLLSFVRGRPAAVDGIRVHQFFNPRGLPLDPRAQAKGARCADVRIVETRPGGLDQTGQYGQSCVVSTDDSGGGVLTLRGYEAGATRVLLLPPGDEPPFDVDTGPAAVAYDNDDELGYWSAAGWLSVRVLPDDWHLDDIPQEDVTFEVMYREVFAYYELLYSFMKTEILSLADECKVATYPRLIWLMSDPRNKAKTFYMPPTRDMSEPKARLMLKYLRADEEGRKAPPQSVPNRSKVGTITTRRQLYDALCQAATIELAVMAQYLYAAWSIPVYGAGKEYLRRGEWSAEQLRLACGDGGEHIHGGIRSSLLNVAREEMIHFLVINNIIMAMGQPFHIPILDFGQLNSRLPVPLDFSLEALSLGSVQRFIALEQPYHLTMDIADGQPPAPHPANGPYAYGSLSELYAAVREGIQRVPDPFVVQNGRGGGEHHLFMRESVNAIHPDYQLEVDDVASAVFAIDFVTEHGEGGVMVSPHPGDEPHFDTFLRISDLLMSERLKGPGGRSIPWNPTYPVMRNPTLIPGNLSRDLVTNGAARDAMVVFNRSYFLMLQLMVQHFGYTPDSSLRRSKLMNAAIDVMTGMLRPVAELVVTLPSGRPGRTAGPSFELEEPPGFIARPDVAMHAVSQRLAHLARMARQLDGLPDRVPELMTFYAEYFRTVDPRDL